MRAKTGQMSELGIDGIAVKPAECDVSEASRTAVDKVIIDYEGREELPERDVVESLGRKKDLWMTTPVRADGFDPLGDDSLHDEIPENVGRVLVAGHPAYLTEDEKRKGISKRLGAGIERFGDAWVGTENVERMALATGATQFELLSRNTHRQVKALRNAGFEGDIAVYAPTVVSDSEDEILEGVGDYVSRRKRVAEALEKAETEEREREILLKASDDYALVGGADEIAEKTKRLREAGVDHIIGYPARGLDDFIY